MATARIATGAQRIATGTQNSISTIRALFPPGSALAKRKNHPIEIINPYLCDQILDRLDLKGYEHTHILDMNPGMGLWSSKLHERLQPRQHTLLEPEEVYSKTLKQFTKDHRNSYHVPLDGYMWDTYTSLFAAEHPMPPFPQDFPGFNVKKVDPEEGINKNLLFVGYLGSSGRGERLIAQFLNCCAVGSWVQSFGRVRFLIWISDSIKESLLPRSIAARARPAVIADAVADIVEVAGSNIVRSGKGYFRRPEIDETNLENEAGKKAPTKRQEAKAIAEIKARKFEEEVERLAHEILGTQPKTKRGRPKKLTPQEQEKVDKAYEKAREEAEKLRAAILDGLTLQQKVGGKIEQPAFELLDPRLGELTPEEKETVENVTRRARKKVEKVRAAMLEELGSQQKFDEEVERLAKEMLGTRSGEKRGRPKKLEPKEKRKVDKVYTEARKKARKARAEMIKALTSEQKFEEDVGKLAAELLISQLKKKPVRPKGLTPDEQEKVDSGVDKEVSEEAAKARAAMLETPQQMLGEATTEEEGPVGLNAKKEAKPRGKRGLAPKADPADEDEKTIAANHRRRVKEVMAGLDENPGVWVSAMEHPPWYYKSQLKRKLLAEEIVRSAAPDPGGKPNDLFSTCIKELGDSASSLPQETTEETKKKFEEFEAQWMKRPETAARNIGREDEVIAIRDGLLKYYQKPYDPIIVNPETDVYPHVPIALLDITPKIPDPYFSSLSPEEREDLWQTFDWLVRNIFVLRASSIKQSLRHVAAGADMMLDELQGDEYINPDKRVRTLSMPELIALTKAWRRWPFKPHDFQFQQYIEKNADRKDRSQFFI